MSSEKKLTDADKSVLAKLPETGWFSMIDIDASINSRYYRCERLVERGFLEDRVVGEIWDLEKQWRRIPIQD